MNHEKSRLITRADFDGIVAGGLLIEKDLIGIGDVLFAEPKDMQDGLIPVTGNDITTNLPYVEGVYLCFDHHVSETARVGIRENHIIDSDAPSAARVVYNHYGGREAFPDIPVELMAAVDRADQARYTIEDILAPESWTLVNFILDPRTGLARFHDFAISNEQLMKDMMIFCRHHPVDEILALPDMEERKYLYLEHGEFSELQILRCSAMKGTVVVSDLRDEDPIYACNRFTIYALFPDSAVSIQITDHADGERAVIAVGRSILNRASKTNIGMLMLEYGGGGHEGAGTCRIDNGDVDRVMSELVDRIAADG